MHSVELNPKAVLLVGGRGTRLRSVIASAPKPLASIGKRSFLELLVRQLRHQAFTRLVMCSGYLADQIEDQFGDGRDWDVSIEYSREQEPLGTAGALRLARPFLEGESEFVVMNGDSFVQLDFAQLLRFHHVRKSFATMVVVPVENAERYGTVRVGAEQRVVGFAEKTGSQKPGLINAGVYVFRQDIFERIPEGPASLERDVFPAAVDKGIFAFEQKGLFIDIGTPEDYARAQAICDQLDEAAFKG
jgi:NDP-sugar pyrophosphorylase family protein